MACTRRRTASSGFMPLLRIARMLALRTFEFTRSNLLSAPFPTRVAQWHCK